MTTTARYDRIGRTYSQSRRTEPRIAAHIDAALGDARRVCNVGGGTGSYEVGDREFVALDPSTTMLAQRDPAAGPAVQGLAEAMPIADNAFDATLCTLTVHHWTDLEAGLRELQRVARRQVVFFFEPSFTGELWLLSYFPEILELPTEQQAPGEAELRTVLAVESVTAVPVPADCVDGFGGCFWNRPEAYLDPLVQEGMSCFGLLDAEARRRGTEWLRADLESGAWDAEHGALRSQSEIDLGYRLLVAQNVRKS